MGFCSAGLAVVFLLIALWALSFWLSGGTRDLDGCEANGCFAVVGEIYAILGGIAAIVLGLVARFLLKPRPS